MQSNPPVHYLVSHTRRVVSESARRSVIFFSWVRAGAEREAKIHEEIEKAKKEMEQVWVCGSVGVRVFACVRAGRHSLWLREVGITQHILRAYMYAQEGNMRDRDTL